MFIDANQVDWSVESGVRDDCDGEGIFGLPSADDVVLFSEQTILTSSSIELAMPWPSLSLREPIHVSAKQ